MNIKNKLTLAFASIACLPACRAGCSHRNITQIHEDACLVEQLAGDAKNGSERL